MAHVSQLCYAGARTFRVHLGAVDVVESCKTDEISAHGLGTTALLGPRLPGVKNYTYPLFDVLKYHSTVLTILNPIVSTRAGWAHAQ